MSHTLNSLTQTGGEANPLSQSETDALLEAVIDKIGQKDFDPDDTQLLQQMVESLGDKRGMVRLSFAEALGEIGKPALPFLLDALANHNNVVVRRAAGKTITLIADPIAIPHLIYALLNDEDTVVKGSVVGALARTGSASVPALLDILTSTDYPESAKGHAAWALSFIGAKAKELLYSAINSPSSEVRCAVVGAICNFEEEELDERGLSILLDALRDETINVRVEAAASLSKLNETKAIPQLLELLRSPDWESRQGAAFALMKLGDRPVIEPLQIALAAESEESTRKAISLAISQIERKLEDDW
jgi:bilin biosynthesis protein